jgi:hypothetical protein
MRAETVQPRMTLHAAAVAASAVVDNGPCANCPDISRLCDGRVVMSDRFSFGTSRLARSVLAKDFCVSPAPHMRERGLKKRRNPRR